MTEHNNINLQPVPTQATGIAISAVNTKKVIDATNNKAQQFAQMAQKYRDEARAFRDETRDYAEENSNITQLDLDNLANYIGVQLALKQDCGDYALNDDIPTLVSQLENDANYITELPENELPSQTGCAGKVLKTNGTSVNWETINSFNLFDFKWSDHELDDMSWLRADTFSWQNGTTYSNAYNHLLEDIDEKTLTSETVSGVTIQYYLADDGHKICPASEESKVTNIYTSIGVAWYYVLDTANTRFKLPRTKYGFVGLRDTVGKFVPEGLPNITGNCSWAVNGIATGSFGNARANNVSSGALQVSLAGNNYGGIGYSGGDSGSSNANININASRSSSTYQDNAPVQQKSTQMYLYFYVGGFSQTATEQTAGLNAELFNGKADINTPSIQAPYLKTAYVNGTSGYNIWSNGYCEQWGDLIPLGATKTITFIKIFKDTNYKITFGFYTTSSSNSTSFYVRCYNKTVGSIGADGCYLSQGGVGYTGGSDEIFMWKACGYLAAGQY